MSTMKALVFEGTGKRTIQERPMPKIEQATDAVVKILKTSICGTDLHILRGDVPTCSPGRILGHEAVGVIDSVGDSIKKFKRGDRVIVFPMTTCSSCGPCAKGMFAHCENGGGWQLGNRIDGVQAEYARVPFADGSLQHMISGASDEAQLIISDVLTTGYECGAIAGRVKPGDTVAIIGAGPVGLGTLLCCQLFSPSTVIVIDLDANRLETAKAMGATHTLLSDSKTVQGVLDLTDGRGADVVIEGVGIPSTFELCQEIVAIGGTIANIGVHGKPGELHLEKLWDRNITIALNLVSCSSAPTLIKLAGAGKLDTSKLVTHTFKFSEMENAYTTFTDAAQHNALKLVIDFD